MKYILNQKISEHLYDAKEYNVRRRKYHRSIGHDRITTYDETKVVVQYAYRCFYCNGISVVVNFKIYFILFENFNKFISS